MQTNYDVAKSVGGGYQDSGHHDVIKTRPDISVNTVQTPKTNQVVLRGEVPTLDIRPGPTADINNQTYKKRFNDMLFADKKLDPKNRNSFLRSRAGFKKKSLDPQSLHILNQTSGQAQLHMSAHPHLTEVKNPQPNTYNYPRTSPPRKDPEDATDMKSDESPRNNKRDKELNQKRPTKTASSGRAICVRNLKDFDQGDQNLTDLVDRKQ